MHRIVSSFRAALRAAVLTATAAVALTACSDSEDPTGPRQEPYPSHVPQPEFLIGAPPRDDMISFAAFVKDKVDAYWQQFFAERGWVYTAAGLNVFVEEYVATYNCGVKAAADGPFYCPADGVVYIPARLLSTLMGLKLPGDFGPAYIIAHEVGHHVQHLFGIWAWYDSIFRATADPAARSDLSVRMEQQADCFAGVWANAAYYQGLLEAGDIEEAQTGAWGIGDDTLVGNTDPTTFTHGYGERRYAWFTWGYYTGDPAQCNTWG